MNFKLSKDVEKNPGPTQYNTDHHEVITRTTTWNLPGPSGTRDYIDIVKPVVLKNPSK